MRGRAQILSIPLLTCPSVTTTQSPVWGIAAQYSYMVVREAAEVESDRSVFFTSDRVAVRAIVRLGSGSPTRRAWVKIHTT
jgi:hypothetical protein